ncbi:LacI family DNA-binding transcriptional regulator [Mangrovibacter plantisponsor]|uniref:LacI family transcriptional regulator n=1 Tax=Mangrovibacter plantisponsor TaxID=451513 RepID=A0A317Q917_9ENTR|nr:LacI family DNA-binding transcriptional regulator [Mangrovibacter plantisponsor]PWW12889.1 LacI family transcriptional regulator [Mangrovibacter plantisponsor]
MVKVPSPNKSTVTAQDVARLAGVSRAVVSRALSNNGSVSPQSRARVEAAARQLGYQVNFLAQGLNRQRSQLIGVVVARLTDPFRSTLVNALLSAIQARGYQALVTEITDEQETGLSLRRFTQFRVSGVVVTSGQPPESIVRECIEHHIPVVGINRAQSGPSMDVVCSDNHAGAMLAAAQLRAAGCQSFIWLNYQGSTWAGRARGEAFHHALTAKGIAPECLRELQAPKDGYEGGFWAAQHSDLQHSALLPQRATTGVFCANALLACGFLDGMRQQGINAPTDFHLIGFDNTPQTAWESYQLTTIHQQVDVLAAKALDCLHERAKNPELAAQVIPVAVELVHRRTSPCVTEQTDTL